MIDANIIDDFDDTDPSSRRRNKNFGFRGLVRSMANSQLGIKTTHGNDPSSALDRKAKRSSWKDLSNIRKYLKSIDDTLRSEAKQDSSHPYSRSSPSTSQQRRAWYSKLRYQQQLISRLTGIEKSLKKKGGGGLGMLGMLGGGLGAILSKFGGKGLLGLIGGGASKGGGGLAKSIMTGLLGAMLGRSAIGLGLRGAGGLLRAMIGGGGRAALGGVKSFGRKAIGLTGNMLRAGKARLLTGILPSLGLGGLSGALGGATGAGAKALTAALRTILPKILGRLGMAVFGVPGAVAMVAKLVWDHLLPESWKKYITYKVSKFYLAAIDKVADMFMWISDKFDEIKNKIMEAYNKAIARIYAALDFVGDLITGEGDARQRVKNYFGNLWNTMETTVKSYVAGFLTVFKEAYNSFIKPFYDKDGNFSLVAGIKYYGKMGYDMGVNAINSAGAAVNSVVQDAKKSIQGLLDSNWNPANWQKNAQDYTKKYEAEQASKANSPTSDKTASIFADTQDSANSIMGQLDKTLKSTNRYLRSATQATMGMASGLAGSFSQGYEGTYSGGATSTDYSSTGSGLSSMVGKAESRGNYNAFNNGTAGVSRGSYDISNMTIGQIKQLQSKSNPGGRKLFAVGKYQIVPDTMIEAQRALNISDGSKMTPQMQDYIFQNYLVGKKRKGVKDFITGKSNDLMGAQVALAQEFASIGMPYTGSMRVGNKTYTFRKDGTFYAKGGGGNKASVSSAESASILQQARDAYDQAIKSGATPQEAWNKSFNATGGMPMSADGGGYTDAGVGTDSSVPTPIDASVDPVGALAQSIGNFNKAGYSSAQVEHESPLGMIVNNDDLLNEIENSPQRVNSMGSQIYEDIRRPTDLGLTERLKQQAKLEQAKRQASSPVVGSSQQDLFNRTNFANVRQHENAFPH